jgi:hypothetical protein
VPIRWCSWVYLAVRGKVAFMRPGVALACAAGRGRGRGRRRRCWRAVRSQQADGQAPEGGHDAGCVPGPDRGLVFLAGRRGPSGAGSAGGHGACGGPGPGQAGQEGTGCGQQPSCGKTAPAGGLSLVAGSASAENSHRSARTPPPREHRRSPATIKRRRSQPHIRTLPHPCPRGSAAGRRKHAGVKV